MKRSWIADKTYDRGKDTVPVRDLPVTFHQWETADDGGPKWLQTQSTAYLSTLAVRCTACAAIVYQSELLGSGLGLGVACLTNVDIIWRLMHPRKRTKCG